MTDDIAKRLEKAEALAELGEQYRRERDEAWERFQRYREAARESDTVLFSKIEKLTAERDDHKEAREEYASDARSLQTRLTYAIRERNQLREQVAMLNANVDTFLAELKQAKKERDEARREADRFRHGCTVEGDFVCPNEYAVSELTAERNFLRALKKNHEEDFTRVCKERDEARAEVQEHREQLRKLPDANRVSNQEAYRRGAEAMREACAVRAQQYLGLLIVEGAKTAEALRALPIPEEP